MDPTRIYCDTGNSSFTEDINDVIIRFIKENIISLEAPKEKSQKIKLLGTMQKREKREKSQKDLEKSTESDDIFLTMEPYPFLLRESFILASIDFHFNMMN